MQCDQSDERGRTTESGAFGSHWRSLAADLAPVDHILAVSLIGDVLAGRLRYHQSREDASVARKGFPWRVVLRCHAVRYGMIPSSSVTLQGKANRTQPIMVEMKKTIHPPPPFT